MANRKALDAARDLRKEFRSRGEFTQSAYRAALDEALAAYKDKLFEDALDGIAAKVDRDSSDDVSGRPAQREFFDLEGEYRLGGNRRVAKKMATLQNAIDALALAEANLDAVQKSVERRAEELARLRPFWKADMTKEQALEAYRLEYPEGGAA